MRSRQSSRSFLIPVSRIKTMMSRKSSQLGCRHLQAAVPANNFLSASSSSLRERPCSFISLIFGTWRISCHSSALWSILLNVRNAQLAFVGGSSPIPGIYIQISFAYRNLGLLVRCGIINMHLLRFFAAPFSPALCRCTSARRCIRVPTSRRQFPRSPLPSFAERGRSKVDVTTFSSLRCRPRRVLKVILATASS